MGIGPIPAIRTLPTAKALKVDPGLTGFLDIEQTSASKEDTFTPGDETAPGGQDDAGGAVRGAAEWGGGDRWDRRCRR